MEQTHEREWFYTAEPKYHAVTKEEFKQFIANYPRQLERHISSIFDPPLITYNDFDLANRWPYSVVARTCVYSDDPNHYYYEPEEKREYRVLTNYEELFLSRTGNKA